MHRLGSLAPIQEKGGLIKDIYLMKCTINSIILYFFQIGLLYMRSWQWTAPPPHLMVPDIFLNNIGYFFVVYHLVMRHVFFVKTG